MDGWMDGKNSAFCEILASASVVTPIVMKTRIFFESSEIRIGQFLKQLLDCIVKLKPKLLNIGAIINTINHSRIGFFFLTHDM